MAEKRRALGRGLGALIPSSPHTVGDRPVDVFFRDREPPVAPPASDPAPASPDGLDRADRQPTPPAGRTEVIGPHVSVSEVTSSARWSATVGQEADQEEDQEADRGADEASERDAERQVGSAQTSVVTVPEPSLGLAPVPGAEFAEIAITAIIPNPKQPRTVFDDDQMAELAHSIREIGVLQPIVVRRVVAPLEETGTGATTAAATAAITGAGTASDGGGEGAAEGFFDRASGSEPAPDQARFELIMGERRWRAAQLAGLESIPAIIKDTHDDDLLRDALLENLHRSELNALEEAAAYQQLLDDFGCSHDELASRIGRSRPQISNTLRLLKLPPLVQRRVAAGVLSAGHARALLGMADGAAMERMAQRIVAEGLSVRTVEELVSLGDDDTPPRTRRPRAGTHHPRLDDYTSHLSDHLETRVNIALGQRRGKITVDFASMDDLQRILSLMGLEGAQVSG
ncbi:MAG: ParB/RepB/Spo0J family partition protein [Humibacillus sp.]|nr:ParB/RepB/Spo0J family partition protein [Humibacillus sp.]MDN5778419.1 ParB/RepB/Spo0J family partition protein [Humibacillus sp.]